MKVLFAVSNEEISEAIVKKYQKQYKEIISYKNVYYFNAILKEIQKDKSYDRIVISEDLETFANSQYDQVDKFIFEKLDSITDEASNSRGENTPIILICSDRRSKGEEMLIKLFGIGIYDALVGNDRSVEEVCKLINKPRTKKEAKMYYKVEAEEVKYQSESENEVSEQEIQNILAHYKRLGKNEEKYISSFNNIIAQYNDTQLRIISKYLPLNVRAVLEEKSPKYQEIMSFNNSVSDSIRKTSKSENLGPSEKLLKNKNSKKILSGPVIIPSSVNKNEVKKLARNHDEEEDLFENQLYKDNDEESSIEEDLEKMILNKPEVPKRRGRPKKNVEEVIEEPVEELEEKTVAKRRGRPRKTPIIEETTEFKEPEEFIVPEFKSNKEDTILPGFEDDNYDKEIAENNILPGFENIENDFSDIDPSENVLPGFESIDENFFGEDEERAVPEFKKEKSKNKTLNYEDEEDEYEEDIEPEELDDDSDFNSNNTKSSNNNRITEFDVLKTENTVNIPQQQNQYNNFDEDNDDNYSYVDEMRNNYNQQMANPTQSVELANLLTGDKKIATFVGTSKNGTSFILNNLAEYASSEGINVAILDTTQNKNSYYIYTKNEEELRQTASECLVNLINGQPRGISINRNLTVYTSLPEDKENIKNVEPILETLVRTHDLILIDCDFKTPLEYFYNAQEIYLVQSLDILTIQPLTAFLRTLKAKNIYDENKLKIILNKYVKIRDISAKTIIGGMSKYSDPSMSFMTDLFDVNAVKYITIPFEQDIYTRYLESVINCDVSIKGYSKTFTQVLKELSEWVYPMRLGKNTYNKPSPSYNGTFSSSMSDTLNRMKKKY